MSLRDYLACLLWFGHADVLQLTPTRIYLRCAHCGRRTKGWEIPRRAPAKRCVVTSVGHSTI